MIYEEVSAVFKDKGCVLLSSKEEVESAYRNAKFRYTAKCGHEHIVFYNVFKQRGTGVICPNCVIIESAKKSKERLKNDKLQCVKLEKRCIDHFSDMIKDEFECIKAFDGCKSDLIFKPLSVEEDEWVGIQVKSTAFKNMNYGFHLKQDYKDVLILCICWEDKRMWMFPSNDLEHLKKITIGLRKSKYASYEVTKENWKSTLLHHYNSNKKVTFDELDTPPCVYHQREKHFRKYRESKIDFLQFTYSNIEGEVYDFICEGFKVQEKVNDGFRKGYLFQFYKHNGRYDRMSYRQGDNDFYWLNCGNKKHFYVIPEDVMINEGIVNAVIKGPKLYVKPEDANTWYSQYMFDYDDIDKQRLLNMFKIK